jgi:glycosyltransferase involved in cell wall biosynthesis
MADRPRRVRPVRAGAVSIVLTETVRPSAGEALAELELRGEGHEVLVVGPDPGVVDGLRTVVGMPRYVECPTATPLGTARNIGAAAARAEYIAFVDPQVPPGPAWVTSALDAFRGNARAAAVVSDIGDEDMAVPCPTLFGLRHSLIVEARAFRWISGYDADVGRGLESIDLCWRLWLAGFEAWFVPASGSRATLHELGEAEPTTIDSVAMLAKNLDHTRAKAFITAAESALRDEGSAAEQIVASAVQAADRGRSNVAETRRVPDAALVERLGDLARSTHVFPEGVRKAIEQSGVSAWMGGRPRVLVVTPDVIAPQMAGPAIRALEIARQLTRSCAVELVSTVRCDLADPGLELRHVDDAALRSAVSRADVVVLQGHVLDHHPWIADGDHVVVVDLYDPIHLEVLEQSRELPIHQRRMAVGFACDTIARQIARGDYFLTASEKQRDLWIGHLALGGRLNATTYDTNEGLRQLVDVVPFGIPDDDPCASGPALRGVVPGIAADDHVVLWAGGVYNWFDPLTLITAVDRLRQRLPTVRLYFMGMSHPHPEVPQMAMAREARRVADDLGLTGVHVFFNDDWVPYDQRANYLLEADVGVSTHLDHVETAFSFRTRILDYLWASLPIVTTAGDGLADVIERDGLGISVPPGDAEALDHALFSLLSDADMRARCREAVRAHRDDFRWERAIAPLARFCATPRRAADLVDPRETALHGDRRAATVWGSGWRQSLRGAFEHARLGEWGEIRRKLHVRLKG